MLSVRDTEPGTQKTANFTVSIALRTGSQQFHFTSNHQFVSFTFCPEQLVISYMAAAGRAAPSPDALPVSRPRCSAGDGDHRVGDDRVARVGALRERHGGGERDDDARPRVRDGRDGAGVAHGAGGAQDLRHHRCAGDPGGGAWVKVKVGQRVKQGRHFCFSGTSGLRTGSMR